MQKIVFVPYRGIYFLYELRELPVQAALCVFVPYRGIYFLYTDTGCIFEKIQYSFSSPIGESTFSTIRERLFRSGVSCSFRPLSGNLLSLQTMTKAKSLPNLPFSSPIGESTFSTGRGEYYSNRTHTNVFVPYRGIYFLYLTMRKDVQLAINSFRPLSGNLLSLRKPVFTVQC